MRNTYEHQRVRRLREGLWSGCKTFKGPQISEKWLKWTFFFQISPTMHLTWPPGWVAWLVGLVWTCRRRIFLNFYSICLIRRIMNSREVFLSVWFHICQLWQARTVAICFISTCTCECKAKKIGESITLWENERRRGWGRRGKWCGRPELGEKPSCNLAELGEA